MKKVLLIFLSLIMCLTVFVGCDNNNEDENSKLQESPVENFEYEIYDEEDAFFVSITKYIGNEEHVVIPAEIEGKPVTTIYMAAFAGTSIKSVTMPDSVVHIDERAFANCKNLETVNFSDNVFLIGKEAFVSCSALKKADLPQKLDTVSTNAFWGCTSLESITVPKSLNNCAVYAFQVCTSLTSLTFEEGITTIGGDFAFQSAESLTKIVIPKSVTKINSYVFANCNNLKEIYFEGDAPSEIGNEPFGEPSKEITIYYNPNTSGWDTTTLKDDYNLVPKE